MQRVNSRREFIKDAGRLSAVTLGLSSIPFASRSGQTSKKLGVALVGLGSYSTSVLSRALTESTRCFLSGIVTGTPSKAEEWGVKI